MRSPANFNTAFEALGMAAGQFMPADIAASATLGAELLAVFNRAYQRGYNLRAWEDAWVPATVTPVNRLVDFSQIGDARRFEIWTADPRTPETQAREVRYSTTSGGALLMTDESTVFILSLPLPPKFTRAAYNAGTAYAVGALVLATDGHCYRCIQAGTGQTPQSSATYWTVIPFLAVLEEFTIAYASGTYELEKGNTATGGERRRDAMADLETSAQAEFHRTARSNWRPKA